MAGVDALLLRAPQFSGRLDAKATVSGSKELPAVEGEFQVSGGAFRQFRYESLNGTVNYGADSITLDARLQQNPAQWITATGYLPTALFLGNPAASPASGNDTVDLTIDSSPIDLGIVQGFTDALTEVKGTLEAHVRVGGTAADPRPEGAVTLRDGAMKVETTGVRYQHVTAHIDLQPDRVRIQELTALDNHNSAMSVTGDLAIDERRLGDVQLYVNAEDFKVIDNDMGNVRIQSSLEVGGGLRAPRVAGYLGVTTGDLNLDNVIAMAATSPYPTEAATAPGAPGAPGAADAADAVAAAKTEGTKAGRGRLRASSTH